MSLEDCSFACPPCWSQDFVLSASQKQPEIGRQARNPHRMSTKSRSTFLSALFPLTAWTGKGLQADHISCKSRHKGSELWEEQKADSDSMASVFKILSPVQIRCTIYGVYAIQSWYIFLYLMCGIHRLHRFLLFFLWCSYTVVSYCQTTDIGLARTVYLHRTWPYVWRYPC